MTRAYEWLGVAPLVLGIAVGAIQTRAGVPEGLADYERGNYAGAAREFDAAAKTGDAQAQYLLGLLYLHELTDPPSPDAALRLIRAAAEQGHVAAQNELARMYRAGDGVDTDPAEMVKWYEQAAEQGDVGAQLLLADVYAYGQGVEKDLVRAYMWYEIAIQYWGPLAVRARDVIGEEMTAEQVTQAVTLASDWIKKNGTKLSLGTAD
ncbi:MAG: tetratricopeptide repeat protein [Hyphomicrobiaceae bacterium]